MTKVVDLFRNLVMIDSPTGEELALQKSLTTLLAPLVTEVCVDKFGNVYARLDGEGEPLFFAAHMDTVEPGRGIKPRVDGEYVVSDGTTILGADNKVAIAVYLAMLSEIKEKNLVHRPIELIFTLSEEVGNYGAINFDYKLLRARKGFCFDSVAPLGTIITASPFYERVDITIRGREAHASKPEQAASVLPVLGELLAEIKTGRMSDKTLCNVGIVNAGTGRNTIPGSAMIALEIRSYLEQELNEQLHAIQNTVEKAQTVFGKNYTLELVSERENPGYYHRSEIANMLIAQVELAMHKVAILPMQFESMAVSDANIFSEHDLLCLNIGDGVEFAHTVRERVRVADLDKLVQFCLALMV